MTEMVFIDGESTRETMGIYGVYIWVNNIGNF